MWHNSLKSGVWWRYEVKCQMIKYKLLTVCRWWHRRNTEHRTLHRTEDVDWILGQGCRNDVIYDGYTSELRSEVRGRGRKAEGYSCRMLDILYTIDYPIYVLWDGLIMTFFIKHVKACSVQCVLRLANEVIEPAGSVSLSFFSYDHIANNPVPPLL